jgi:hypothetical protein
MASNRKAKTKASPNRRTYDCEELKTVGDVVYLNSGSPPLRVRTLHTDRTVTVTWINEGLGPSQSLLGSSSVHTLCLPEACFTKY